MADEINLVISTDDSDLDKTHKKLSGLGDAANDAASKGSRGLGGFAQGFANMGLGILGAQAGIQALSGAVTGLFSGNIQFEQFETQFKVLLGSADAAKARISELSDFARTTPFELPEVVKASATLETLTQGALATGEGLRMVGDVAAGTGVPMDELAVTMGRLYDSVQSGRSVGEELARLQEIGAVSGETRSQIEAMLEAGVDGAVIWETVADGMGRYSGMMEEQSATVGGALSNISDGLGAMKRNIMQGIFDAAKPGIMAFASWLGSEGVQGAVQKAGAALGVFMTFIGTTVISGITALVQTIGPLVPVIIDFVQQGIAIAVPYLQQFGETLVAIVPSVVAFIQAFAAGAIDKVMTAFQTLSPILEPIARAFLLLAANVPAAVGGFMGLLGALEPLAGIIDATLGWIVGNAPVMNGLLAALGVVILAQVVPAVVAWTAAEILKAQALIASGIAFVAANLPLIAIIATVALLVAGITLLVTHWDTITAKVPFLGVAVDAVKAVIDAFLAWFTGDFVSAITSAWDTITGIFTTSVDAIRTFIETNMTTIQTIIDTVWGLISVAFEFHWTAIKLIVTTAIDLIKLYIETTMGLIQGIFNVIMGLITGDWDRAWDGLKQIADTILQAITGLIDIGMNGIHTLISGIWTAITGTFTVMWSGISTIFSTQIEAVKGFVQGLIDKITGARDTIVGAFEAITGSVSGWAGSVGGFIDGIVGKVQSLTSWINNIPSMPDLTPGFSIPGFAEGTQYFRGGYAIVGEKGPELVTLPRGTAVYSNRETNRILSGRGAQTGAVSGKPAGIGRDINVTVVVQGRGEPQDRALWEDTGRTVGREIRRELRRGGVD